MAEPSGARDLIPNRKAAFFLWGLPIILYLGGFFLPGVRGILSSIAFLWIGGACLANALRCRRAHCVLMGPLFLILGLVSILNTVDLVSIPWRYMGRTAGVVVILSFLPEWFGKKYFSGKSRS